LSPYQELEQHGLEISTNSNFPASQLIRRNSSHSAMELDSETVLVPPSSDEIPRVVLIRDRLREFTWSWFSVTMSTGSLAILLSMTPNRFPGLTTIGSIVFILDLVLFVAF